MRLATYVLTLMATAALSGCGSDDKSSSPVTTAPPVEPPTQPTPPVEAPAQPTQPIVLTEQQKLDIGKAFIDRFGNSVGALPQQIGSLANTIADAINAESEEAIEQGDFELKQGVVAALYLIEILPDAVFQAAESIRDQEHNYGDIIPVSSSVFHGQVIASENDNGTVSYDVSFFMITSDVDSEISSRVDVTVTEGILDYDNGNENDPANKEYRLTISGSMINNEMQLTLDNAFLSSVYVNSDSQYFNQSDAIKQISLTIDRITANISDSQLVASTSVSLTLSQPLQNNDEITGFYQNDRQGNMELLSSCRDNYIPFMCDFFEPVIDVLAFISPGDSRQVASLNLEQITLSNSNITLASGEIIDIADLSLESDDRLFRAAETEPGTELARYAFNEDQTQLTLTNRFGQTIYRFEAVTETTSAGIYCETQAVSYLAAEFARFRNYRCPQALRNFDSLQSFLDSGLRMQTPTDSTSIAFIADENSLTQGSVVAIQYLDEGIDNLFAPLDYTINAELQLQTSELNESIQIQLNHPEALDYQLQAKLGSGATAIEASWGVLNPMIELQSQAVIEQQTFAITLSVNLDEIFYGFELDPNEQQQQQIEQFGFYRQNIGEMTVDGEKQADVYFLNGHGIEDSHPDDLFLLAEGIAVAIEFIDGTTPENALFTTDTQFSIVEKDCAEDESPEETNTESCDEIIEQGGVMDVFSIINTFFNGLGNYLRNPFISS